MKMFFKIPENYRGMYFEKESLEERFDQILNYYGLKIYDANHVIEQFHSRFPHLTIEDYKRVFLNGLKKIVDKWDYTENQYAIISKSTKIKIQVQIRPDEKRPNEIIGVTASTLHADNHPFNTRGEIEVLVEESKKNNSYEQIPEFENILTRNDYDYHWFNHYFECGEHYQDFEYIEVE